MRNSPSAAIVYTGQSGGRGDGQGSAVVLDENPDFLPYAQNIFAAKRQEQIARQAQERQKANELKKILNSPELGKIPLESQQQIAKGLKGYQELAIKMGSGEVLGSDGRRLDPLDPYDLEAQRMLKEKEFELVNLAEASRDIDNYFMEVMKAADDPKYDKAEIVDWATRYKNAPTIEERIKLRQENPLKEMVSMSDVVDDAALDYQKVTKEQGMTTTVDEFLSPESIRISAENSLFSPKGKALYEQGLEKGKWKDEEEYFKAFEQQALAWKPRRTSSTQDEPRSTGDGSGGSKGGARFVPSTNPKVSKTTGTNVVTANWGTQAPPTLSFVDDNGQAVLGKFVAAKQTADGKSWIAEVQVVEEEVVPWSPAELLKIEQEQADNPDFQPEPKTKSVTRVVRVPLDNRVGYQGNDNYSTISDAVGQPLEQVISQGGKKTSGKYVGLDEDGNPIFE